MKKHRQFILESLQAAGKPISYKELYSCVSPLILRPSLSSELSRLLKLKEVERSGDNRKNYCYAITPKGERTIKKLAKQSRQNIEAHLVLANKQAAASTLPAQDTAPRPGWLKRLIQWIW